MLDTTRDLLRKILQVLSSVCRAPVFPGGVILHEEERLYPYELESFTA